MRVLLLLLLASCMTAEQSERLTRAERRQAAIESHLAVCDRHDEFLHREVAAARGDIEASRPMLPQPVRDLLEIAFGAVILALTGRWGWRGMQNRRASRRVSN